MHPLAETARLAPVLPGVYLFKDAAGAVLYVGKAQSLRRRLADYFRPDVPDKTRLFLTRARALETLICNSPYEALILEHNLIKEHRPPFNIIFRDDKRYPYIKITHEDFPRVILTRRIEKDGAEYFGPYAGGHHVRKILDMTRRFFKMRSCRRAITVERKRPSVCLDYHIKRCDGPCEHLISTADYGKQVDRVRAFLKGDYDELVRDLRVRMKAASVERQFELAAMLRDQAAAVGELSEKQRAATTRARDVDALAHIVDPNRGRIGFYVFKIRKGHIVGNAGFVFAFAAATPEEALAQFLPDYYKMPSSIPPEIALIAAPAGAAELQRWLAERAGHRVRFSVPRRGYLKDLVELARKNGYARLYERGDPAAEPALDRVRETLGLTRRPEIIHGFDVANLGDDIVTGSRVVFAGGVPAKADYRSFGLKSGPRGKDDYAAMRELVGRSMRHAGSAPPDLILVDGGLGHVRAARQALEELFGPGAGPVRPADSGARPFDAAQGRVGFEIAGLAKEEELLVLEDGRRIKLGRDDPALNLLQRVRDEAHRFSRRLMHSRAKKRMLGKSR